MKTILKITALSAVLLILAGGLISCRNKEENCMPFVTIAQGSLHAYPEIPQQNTVIRAQEKWDEFITPFTSPFSHTNSFGEMEIDFSTYQIIAVVDEIRPVIQWGMRITCIKEYMEMSTGEDFGRIVVSVTVFRPKGSITSPAVVQNYHIVKIPISKKNIEFDVRVR